MQFLKKNQHRVSIFSPKNEFRSYFANCEAVVFTLQKDLALLGGGDMTLVFLQCRIRFLLIPYK